MWGLTLTLTLILTLTLPITGLYLPLVWGAEDCVREPICLAYDAGHFWSLVPMDAQNDNPVVPLCTQAGAVVDTHFILPEENPVMLMQAYLDCIELGPPGSGALAARLSFNPQPHLEALMDAYISCRVGAV